MYQLLNEQYFKLTNIVKSYNCTIIHFNISGIFVVIIILHFTFFFFNGGKNFNKVWELFTVLLLMVLEWEVQQE